MSPKFTGRWPACINKTLYCLEKLKFSYKSLEKTEKIPEKSWNFIFKSLEKKEKFPEKSWKSPEISSSTLCGNPEPPNTQLVKTRGLFKLGGSGLRSQNRGQILSPQKQGHQYIALGPLKRRRRGAIVIGLWNWPLFLVNSRNLRLFAWFSIKNFRPFSRVVISCSAATVKFEVGLGGPKKNVISAVGP